MRDSHTPFLKFIIKMLLLSCALEFLFVGYLFYTAPPLPSQTFSYTEEADIKAQAQEIHQDFFSGFLKLRKQFYDTSLFYNAEKACLDLIDPPKYLTLERGLENYEYTIGRLHSIFPQNFILLLTIYVICSVAAAVIHYNRYVFPACSLIVFSSFLPLPEIADKFELYGDWGLFYWTTPQLFFGAILLLLWYLEKVSDHVRAETYNRVSTFKDRVYIDDPANLPDTVNEDSLKKALVEPEQQYKNPINSMPMAFGADRGRAQEGYSISKSISGTSKDIFETGANSLIKFGCLSGIIFSLFIMGVTIYFESFVSSDPEGVCVVVVPACALFGLFCFLRYVYYRKLHVWIDPKGIRMEPGNRNVQWNQVEEILYSISAGDQVEINHMIFQFMQLTIKDAAPIRLLHRFVRMTELLDRIRNYVEPIVLGKLMKRFHKEGSVSFGKMTITQESIIFKGKQAVPLDQVHSIDLEFHSADKLVYHVVDHNGELLFWDYAGHTPNATVLPNFLQKIKGSRKNNFTF